MGLSTALPSLVNESPTLASNSAEANSSITDVSFEQVGTVAGGLYAAGLYSLTAPVTLLDGPLPFVDSAWLAGLGWATLRGANAGRKAGRVLDETIELVS